MDNCNDLPQYDEYQSPVTGQFAYCADSDRGKVRSQNEDAFIVEPQVGLFVVCDGMGGHRGGAMAAQIVVEDLSVMIENRLHDMRSDSPAAIRSMLAKTIIKQNRDLCLEQNSESGFSDMGATVVVLLLRSGRAYIANLGDSRIYLFRNGKLRQLTKDHSVVAELIDQGAIEPHQAEDHAAQGLITRYVGMPEKPKPHVRSIAIKENDRFLLCTDGLTDMVDDSTIAQLLLENENTKSACAKLLESALNGGGHDNITTIMVRQLSL